METEASIHLAHEAFVKYQALAEQGDTQAQLILAGMLAEGIGTDSDQEKSESWYKRAPQDGSPKAQHHLGYISYKRNDYSDAFNWYQEAASQGYLPALWRLAWLYKQGKGVQLDTTKACELFDQAVKGGHIFAKREFALMLLYGHQGFVQIFRGLALLFRCVLDGTSAASKSDPDHQMKI